MSITEITEITETIRQEVLDAIPFNGPITLVELRKKLLCAPQTLIDTVNDLICQDILCATDTHPVSIILKNKAKKLDFSEPTLIECEENLDDRYKKKTFNRLLYHKKSRFFERLSAINITNTDDSSLSLGNNRTPRTVDSFTDDIDALLPKSYRRKACGIPRKIKSYHLNEQGWRREYLNEILRAYIPHGERGAWDNISLLESSSLKGDYSLGSIHPDVVLDYYVRKKTAYANPYLEGEGFVYLADSYYNNWDVTLFGYYKPLALCNKTDLVSPKTERNGRWGYLDAEPLKSVSPEYDKFTLASGVECTPNDRGEVVVYHVDNHLGNGMDFLSVLRPSMEIVKHYLSQTPKSNPPLRDYYLFMARNGIPVIEAVMLEPFIPGCYSNLWCQMYQDIIREYPLVWDEAQGVYAKVHLLHRMYNEVPYQTHTLTLRERLNKSWLLLLQPWFAPVVKEMANSLP